MSARIHPVALLLLAGGAFASFGCSSLTEPNDIEVSIVAEPPPRPAPAPALPGPAPAARPAPAPPAGGG